MAEDYCMHLEAADQIEEILGEFDVSDQIGALLPVLVGIIASTDPQCRPDLRAYIASEVAETLERTRELELADFKADLQQHSVRKQQDKERRAAPKLDVVKH
jgi:hypothetical protein